MKLLLDQGLTRSSASLLRAAGLEAVHTGEADLATALDSEILDRAVEQSRVVVTLDSDFHAIVALSGSVGPSVIRIRVEGLRAEAVADLVVQTIELCREDLERGALVSVEDTRIRIRRLPIASP